MPTAAAPIDPPHRLRGAQDWHAVLALIQRAFAAMAGRIDPPSSLHHLTAADLAAQSETAEIWAIGAPIRACMILTPKPAALYLGKLAVDPAHQRSGLGRALVSHAETRARALGLPVLGLQTRIELIENQAAFTAMGFAEVARTAHPGHTKPTSITYAKPIHP